MKRTTRQALATLALLVAAASSGAQAVPSGDVDPTGEVRVRADAVGKRVHVHADGLSPDKRFAIGAGPVDSEYHVLAFARADSAGRFVVSLPLVADLGDQSWVIVVADRKGQVLGSATVAPWSPTLAALTTGL